MGHVWEAEFRYLNGKGFDLTGPYRGNAVMHRSQRETADSIKQTAHRQHKLRIVHFRASTKIHSLRCASSPHTTRFTGLVWGPRYRRSHLDTACTTVLVVLTAAWAV